MLLHAEADLESGQVAKQSTRGDNKDVPKLFEIIDETTAFPLQIMHFLSPSCQCLPGLKQQT